VSERAHQAVLDRPGGGLDRAHGAARGGQRTENPLAALQRALGNQVIQRAALAPSIAPPEDEHEREAERLAALVSGGASVGVGAIGGAPEGIGRQVDEERKKKPELAKPAAPPPKRATPLTAPAAATPAPAPPKPAPGKADLGKGRETTPPTGVRAGPGTAPPKPVKEAPAGERKRQEEQSIAMKSERGGTSTPQVTPAVTASIGGAQGSGRSLPPSARSYFEPRLGHDLSGVRVHDDASAARAASDLQAQAFTYGQDVYFGGGRFQPHTAEGRRLLAHELTHTVQQRPGAPLHRRAIQRAADPPAGQAGTKAEATTPTAVPDPTKFTPEKEGQLQSDPSPNETVLFDKVQIPKFKREAHRAKLYDSHKPQHHYRRYDRGEPKQREKWRNEVPGTPAVVAILQTKHGTEPPETGVPYVFSAPPPESTMPPRYFIGADLDTVAKAMNLPSWDRKGNSHKFDVDHVVELQLAGWDKTEGHWANTLENMELLDSSANSSSGSRIANNINARVKTFVDATAAIPQYPRSPETFPRRFHAKFQETVAEDADTPKVTVDDYWTVKDIEDGEHAKLAVVKTTDPSEVGVANKVKVFSRKTGGIPRSYKWDGTPKAPEENEKADLAPFTITQKSFDTKNLTGPELGEFKIELETGNDKWEPLKDRAVPIHRIPGLPFAGYADRDEIRKSLSQFRKTGSSPIQIDEEPDLLPGGGIGVTGQILPEVPALKGAGINFELAGFNLRVWKRFSIEDVKVPKPFVINDVSLEASAGTKSGIQLTGQVDFEVQKVGQGMLRASAGTERGIEFDGEFNFDSKLFNPAKIGVFYRNGAWGGSGDLGIPPGKVPGIKKGLFHVAYSEGRLDATGTADTTIPGVSQAAMQLSYSEAEGLAIGGELTLAPTVPGLRGGRLKALVQQRPEQNDYKVSAHGEAQPAIPGVDATLTVDYDDGALTIQGSAAYSRGPVSGQLTLGATNRPVDPQGNIVPTGAPGDQVAAYGGGAVTIRLTPWLQGTAGMRILPNGEVELAGAIGLPATVDIFPAKNYDRNILTLGFDIPIVGVAVAGQRIGIFASIKGGLDFSAGVGPGQLQELGLQITFNPDHLDKTHIEGGARLHIPAHAGLRLFVRGSLGVGIPIVSASAGLEVGGALGLEGAVDAGVHVDWLPTRGLILDAAGEIYVEPRFRFDITGFVLVEADLLITTVELYSKRWQLAAVEYGSGLRLGMRFPIHYEEGKPFEMSWSDVQFQIPDVSPRDVLAGLIEQIA
jgi:Domain of unknown function (DUF4157)